MNLAEVAFVTVIVFALVIMAVGVVAMIIRREPVSKVDEFLVGKLNDMQERQIVEGLEVKAREAQLQEKLITIGKALEQIAVLTDIKSDDELAKLILDIATPGPPV
jgi:hypothetical protein